MADEADPGNVSAAMVVGFQAAYCLGFRRGGQRFGNPELVKAPVIANTVSRVAARPVSRGAGWQFLNSECRLV